MELAEARAEGADESVDLRTLTLLAVQGLTIRFGGVTALDDVCFEVARGAICGLIGPNGAGKTTLFNCISRLYDPATGSIVFDGRPLLSCARHELASLGVGRTFQNVALFSTMTVRENICVGAHGLARGGFVANALDSSARQARGKRIVGRADALIEEFGLKARRGSSGGRPAVRCPRTSRACPRARERAKTLAVGRTGRRAQPFGSRRTGR